MDAHERILISGRLSDLMEFTTCSTELLIFFLRKKILTLSEIREIMGKGGRYDKTIEFYKIIQTKTNAFAVLIEGLTELGQSGAIEILKTLPVVTSNNNHKGIIPFTSSGSEYTGMIQVGSSISYFPKIRLGKGKGSEVFEGKFNKLKRVAVKRFKEDSFEYLEKEVNLLNLADGHSNVIRYINHHIKDGFHYIALDLCQATLKDWVEKTEKGLDVQGNTDLEILSQCVEGLMFIHERKVVHRDLRPSNILLFRVSQDKIVVKISDFGLGKKYADDRHWYTHAGFAGSLGWTAPEVETSQKGDKIKIFINSASVDTFSLGCIFYNVVTKGGHPFGDKEGALTRQLNIKMGQLTISPDVPYNSRGMINLIKLMINSTPEERPPLCIVKSHPVFWDDTDKVFRFFGRIKSTRSDDRQLVAKAFNLLDKLAWLNKVLGDKGFLQAATNKFGHNFWKEGYGEDAWSLIRAIRNYGPEGHKNDSITPESFRLPREAEYVNDWLDLFPKILPCAWVAFKGLADAGVEGFDKFYGDKGDPFWKTDACRDLI